MKTAREIFQSDTVPQVEVKKPYQKPDITFQAPLEAMAAECLTTKGDGQGTCIPAFS